MKYLSVLTLISMFALVSFFSMPFVYAQNRVVVIPLGGDMPVIEDVPEIEDVPVRTDLAFPRISTECLSGETTFLEGLSTDVNAASPSFFLDDSDGANPFISAVNNGPTLPDSTSRIDVFVRGIGQSLDAEISIRDGAGNLTSLENHLNNCSEAGVATPFSNSAIQSSTQQVTSITGQTWVVTSNAVVVGGTITLGPTLFRLSSSN